VTLGLDRLLKVARVKRSSKVIAASATAAVAVGVGGLGLAGVAQAGGATLTLSSSTVVQGGVINATAVCPGAGAVAAIGSAALPSPAVPLLPPGGSPWKVEWHIGHVTPGKYEVALACGDKNGKLTGITTTMLTVTKATKPFPPTPPGPRVVFGPTIVIHSGLGGMARHVAGHHPAG